MRIKSLQDLPEAIRKANPELFHQIQDANKIAVKYATPLPLKEPTKKRIRQDKPLNKLETEFLNYLKAIYPSNRIVPQAMRFRLGSGIWYKVDMVMFTEAGLFAYEVKGPHAFRGGFENLKVAASLYPEVEWFLVWKENNTWQEQRVLP